MEYQNVTLSLPKEVLRRAKHIAIERGTSLSGLLTHLLDCHPVKTCFGKQSFPFSR
ncbi:hypothetical protein SAMN02745218_02952 [Desulfofundulus australicus DSM 11792]|uniref:Uncharacterized protein n=1 Tax=Desulfofundulus australicus DSM 11792 TaxID=1121425 RepID=A0A1M5DYR4_9FIRM|nr:DUF6364 family protein [Desulfofundulus australicus]SHF72137.1 hypothetical protein SAMN02745218_02952 [Desulfofundulus australicus DSM 11792]